MPVFVKPVDDAANEHVESFDGERIRVGRQADNDLRFDPKIHMSVSGYHAEIYRDGERYYIKDLQSRNGTLVNSRKIDQPIALKDGDIIQFSARGPSVVFSTKDPQALAEDDAVAAPEDAKTQVFAAEDVVKDVAAPPMYAIGDTLRRYLPVMLAGLLLLILLAAGRWIFDFPWWGLLIGAAIFVVVGGGGYLCWRSWRRRKAAAGQKQAAHQEREISLGRGDKDNLQDLKKKWGDVLRSLKDSKLQRAGDDPLYAFPWYLVLGEPGSGKSSLLKAAGPLSSVTTPGGDGPTRNCDWWFFDKSVLLDLSGRYVFQAKESDAAGEWQALLSLLKTDRRREPINGVIVTLPVDSLISRPFDKLKEQAALLRERLDEVNQQLGVRFPVYLMVTKCDLIAGFHEVQQALPDQVKGQAMGYVNPDPIGSSDATRFFERAFRVICARTERLRLASLQDAEEPKASRGIFLFPAELRSLQTPLKAFIDILMRPSPYRDAPFFRGLFFASARAAGAPLSRVSRFLGIPYAPTPPQGSARDQFLRDFVSVILPGDRVLTGSTALSRERSQMARTGALIGAVAASLILCGVLTLSFTNNWRALSRLNVEPCTLSGSGLELYQALRPLDECRQVITGVIPTTFWAKVAYDFGLGYAQSVGRALQQRYLAEFRGTVLKPIDERIDQSLASEAANAFVVSLVVQRIDRLARCQDTWPCIDPDKANQIGYRAMLSVAQAQVKEGDAAIDRLQRTHESYLLWEDDPKILKATYARDLERLRNWARRGRLTEEWVLESTRTQFEPIRARDYWRVNVPLQVDAAYTAQAWRSGIQPLVTGLQKMSADQDFSAALQQFQESYRTRAIGQWDNFLTRFADAENALGGTALTREFGARMVAPESPYFRALEATHANLSSILEDAWQQGKLQPWAVTLKRFMALKAKIKPGADSAKAAPEQGQNQDEQEAKYLASYLDAIAELRSDLAAPDRTFKSAQKAFQDGEVSAKATQPALKATWALSALRDAIGARQGEDAMFWLMLERPVALAWRSMLAETARQLQEQWYRLLLGVKNQQDPGIVAERIYGFATDGPAAPFLVQGRWAGRPLLKERVPFTDAFLQYLTRLRSNVLNPSAPSMEPPAAIVRIG
jgi:type VI secretion system protein ImpL